MTRTIDYKRFQEKLNKNRPDKPVTEDEAVNAYRNLGEFFWLLYKINEREKIVPMEELTGTAGQSEPLKPSQSTKTESPLTPS